MLAGQLEIRLFAEMARLQRDMDQARRSVGGAMAHIEQTVGRAKAALGGLIGVLSVKQILQYGDAWGQLSSRMAISTGSTEAGNEALKRLMDLSNRVYKPIEATSELYIRTAKTLDEMGYSAESSMKTVEALSFALTVSGADTQKSEAVMDAWSKAILKGKMDMDGFGTIIASAPRLQQALSESLGVTNAGLMKMVLAGKLTADQMMKVGSQSVQLGKETDQMPVSMSDAFTKMRNSLMLFFGQVDNGVGVIKLLTTGIGGLAEKISEISKAGPVLSGLIATINSLMAAIVPALKIIAAYYTIFVAAPAILATATAMMTPLIHAVALHTMNVMIGQTATIGWNTALFGTAVAANTAAGGLFTLITAGSALFSAFAGWQIGTYLRDNFVEARVAGLAFVGAMLKGWEHVKYGAQMAWEGVKFAWDTTINGMKASFAGYLTTIAAGLSMVGAIGTANQVNAYAESLRSAAASQKSFAEQTVKITEEHRKAAAVIDDNITEMVAYELGIGRVVAAENEDAKAKGGKGKAVNEVSKAYAAALKHSQEYLASLRLEFAQVGMTADQLKMMAAAAEAAKAPTKALALAIMETALALDIKAKNYAAAEALKKVEQGYLDAREAAQAFLDVENRARQREVSSMGQGVRARDFGSAISQIEEKYAQQLQELQRDNRNGVFEGRAQDYERELALISEFQQKSIDSYTAYYAQIEEHQGKWQLGMSEALANYRDDSRNIFRQTSDLFTNAMKNMENSMVDFAMTGKLSFSDLARSVIADMIRMQSKATASGLFSWLGTAVGGMFGGGTDVVAAMRLDGLLPSAKGNVFESAGLSAYSNQIVTKPTTFAFARGAGLMGEAGPEAIMPLTRTSGGVLGVKAVGGGGDTHLTVIVNAETGASKTQGSGNGDLSKLGNLIGNKVREVILEEKRNGGLLTA